MTSSAAQEGQASPASLDLRSVPHAERTAAFDRAFDYRGDVTLHLDDGTALECYVFDRREGKGAEDSVVRVMPSDGGPRRSIPYGRIVGLAFTGKDTAAGKTWENWVRRYVEKRLAGEHAGIEADPLD